MNSRESNTDIVLNVMNALEVNDQESVESYLAEAFTFSGWTPQPLGKPGFLSLIKHLKEGIPGLIFNLHNILEEDERVLTGTLRISGYQSQSFSLQDIGFPDVALQGRSIALPSEDVTYRFEQGQLVAFAIEPVVGGGLAGLLHQLGVNLPVIQ